MWNIKVSN